MSTLRPQKEILLDLIFVASDYEIPYDLLYVGDPRINDNPDMVGDTAVTITSLDQKRWTGSVVSTFDKLDLEWLFSQINLDTLELEAYAQTIHQLIPLLQLKYGFNVETDDLLDGPIEWTDGEAMVMLQASPDSLFYKGQILAEVIKPQLIPLSEVIRVTSLGGLHYPQTA